MKSIQVVSILIAILVGEPVYAQFHSLDFNGNSDFLLVPDADELKEFPQGFTIEAWVNPDSYSAYYFGVIVRKHSPPPSMGYDFGVYAEDAEHSGGELSFYSEGNPSGGLDSPPNTVELNEWTHVAVTHDGTYARLWANGMLVAEDVHDLPSPSDDPLAIGANPEGNHRFWSGLIFNLRISTGARYTDEFTPPVVFDVDENTI